MIVGVLDILTRPYILEFVTFERGWPSAANRLYTGELKELSK